MKNKYKTLLITLVSLSFLSSCDDKIEFVNYQPQIVVEGRIENGQYASILLSTSVAFTDSIHVDDLFKHTIKSARVTISDGTQSEVLFLKTNYDKIPPYEYVTRKIKGEAGKTYYLTIEHDDLLIEGETFIPQPVSIDSLWFVKKNESDTTGYIHIQFANTSKYHYQIATKGEKEDVFIPCLYGNIDRSLYPSNEKISLQINKGPVIFPEVSYKTYFKTDEEIQVKLLTQTQESYNFWTSYQNEILNSQNPIFPSTNRLKSNTKGAIGIWAGYGSVTKRIKSSKN